MYKANINIKYSLIIHAKWHDKLLSCKINA